MFFSSNAGFTFHFMRSSLILLSLLWASVAFPQPIDDPITDPIQKSGIAVELDPFVVVPQSGDVNETHADINFVYPAYDGSGDLYVADTRGIIWRIADGVIQQPAFLDIADLRGFHFYLEHVRSTGLRSFAFHPDCGRAGRAGDCKLYTAYAERFYSALPETPLFKGGFPDIYLYHNVVAEWDVDLSGSSPSVDVNSRRELMRVEQRAPHHNLDQLMFNPNSEPGDSDYGLMWITLGDGISSPGNQDPDDQSRNPLRLLGKVARIDPLEQGSQTYTVPSSNPFVGDSNYLPEIWALGLRHPQNISFDTAGTQQIYITEVGESQLEEVNIGVAGADYGWPERQGTFENDRNDPTVVYPLPSNDASLGFTYPVAQYDHDEGFAIVGGYVYRGTEIPELYGHYIFGDIVKGRVFHVPVSDFQVGFQAEIKELTLLFDGDEMTLPDAVSQSRADLRIGVDADNELLISSKQNGQIWKVKNSGQTVIPAKPTLVSPSGTGTSTPTYIWNAVSGAAEYDLWVNDTATGVQVVRELYSAGDAGCSSGTGQCSVTPATSVGGSVEWWVQAKNSAGSSPWSDSLSFTVSSGVPGLATLISPSGSGTTNPAYTWNAVSDASWYYLWVDDDSGSGTIKKWYTAAQAGCSGGTGTCSITGPNAVSGDANWWIQTWNAAGTGPWSSSLSFTTGGPGQAALIDPTGSGWAANPTYQWNAVSTSTWYYLWVNDASGSETIKTWYTAASAGCSNGGTCSITPSTSVSGSAVWWIRTWSPAGAGPWSSGKAFSVANNVNLFDDSSIRLLTPPDDAGRQGPD